MSSHLYFIISVRDFYFGHVISQFLLCLLFPCLSCFLLFSSYSSSPWILYLNINANSTTTFINLLGTLYIFAFEEWKIAGFYNVFFLLSALGQLPFNERKNAALIFLLLRHPHTPPLISSCLLKHLVGTAPSDAMIHTGCTTWLLLFLSSLPALPPTHLPLPSFLPDTCDEGGRGRGRGRRLIRAPNAPSSLLGVLVPPSLAGSENLMAWGSNVR